MVKLTLKFDGESDAGQQDVCFLLLARIYSQDVFTVSVTSQDGSQFLNL